MASGKHSDKNDNYQQYEKSFNSYDSKYTPDYNYYYEQIKQYQQQPSYDNNYGGYDNERISYNDSYSVLFHGHLNSNCFYIIIYDVLAMVDRLFNNFIEYIRDARNDEIKSIFLGLFALIGFIILIYSIFVGLIREPLASVADTVLVAVIIGSFTLIGIILGKKL
jgi:hypothetical protein